MRRRFDFRTLPLAAVLTTQAFAQAPSGTPEPTCVPTASKPCPPAPHQPSAAERFPYPGAASTPAPSASHPPDAPGSTTPTDAAHDHPFPGTPSPDEGSSSSSSSTAGVPSGEPAAASDANDPTDTPDPAAPPRRRRLPKVNAQSEDEREAEDLDIAHYYFGRGNYTAAYLRSKDAVKALPDDPEGHLAVAEAAEKLNKRDEAVQEYKLYLSLEPDGDKAKGAKKALGRLK